MVEVSGSLTGTDLAPMIRLLSELRQTGSLQLTKAPWSARLELHEGRVVGAWFAEEHGVSALNALSAALDHAEFVYVEGARRANELDLTPERVDEILRQAASPVVVPPTRPGRQLGEWLLPLTSVALTVAVVVAGYFTFVRPRVDVPPVAVAPTVVPSLEPATEPTLVPTLAPTSVPTAAPTPVPTSGSLRLVFPPNALSTPLATRAPTATPVAAPVPVTLLDAFFAQRLADWMDSPPVVAWSGGAYQLSSVAPGRFVAVAAPLKDLPDDVELRATFRKIGGPAGGGFGLILRDQAPAVRDGVNQAGRFYVVEVGDLGQIGMWRRDNDRWVDILPWTDTAAVKPGNAVNELTVRAVGPQFTVIINGIQLPPLADATFTSGRVGFFVGGDGNVVAVEHFSAVAPAKTVQ